MKNIHIIFVGFLTLFSCLNVPAEIFKGTLDKQYPNRKYFSQLNYITTKQMINALTTGKYNIIDARPKTAFNLLHVKNATNIGPNYKRFKEKLMDVVNKNDKPIVFYCDDWACLESYKASVIAIALFKAYVIKREVLTYDSGINVFSQVSPEWVLKKGKEISPDNPLIDLKNIKKHAKSSEEFVGMISNDDNDQYVLLDIRENNKKLSRNLFMFKNEKKITLLKSKKLMTFLNQVRGRDLTLMVYGTVEKQIETLYPLIKTSGINKWFYLEGGEMAFSEYMVKKHVVN